jgi:aromatic-amino-acid transaminase
MRDRIKAMRAWLAEGLKARGVAADFGFILRQRGMFSYSGLTAEQVARLQKDFGVYAVSSGRICVAALNSRNIEYACDGIAAVLKG